jgi:tetratricopeptide (TPR) repeat protein
MGMGLGVPTVEANEAGIGYSLSPDIEQVLIRGMERGIEGDYGGAVRDFTTVIQAYPYLSEGYFNRGIAYQRQSNWKAAIADFDQTLRLDPEFADAYLARGQIYAQLGDHEAALGDLQQSAALFQQQGNAVGYQQAIDAIAQLD